MVIMMLNDDGSDVIDYDHDHDHVMVVVMLMST
jgi:hypothetical protein